MKFYKYINEGKLSTKEKKELTQRIMSGTANDLSIDNHKVKVKKSNDGMSFTYPKDLWELTVSLVDICDAMGLTFKEVSKKNETIFTVNL